eukprot:TRINITY_DN9504_c0_g1_i1.p1 TRINITY_DN9504_c0_g1~~TRINITY_DN9504_c0_g1_i1.p1  ORF type:complete len:222 (-),score=40.22 TRINITY_DN9504_c0_g1_i1:195-860(-)
MDNRRLNGYKMEEDPRSSVTLISGGVGGGMSGAGSLAAGGRVGGGVNNSSAAGGGGGDSQQHCCLMDGGKRCLRPAGNASYSKRIQKTVSQRNMKLSLDQNSRHIYICEFHKAMIQTVRVKRKRRESEESGGTDSVADTPHVDLFQLQMNTLRRYKKHFKVTSRPGINKTQLAESLTRHFKTIPVAEKEALTFFIYMIKTRQSKLDRERPDANPGGAPDTD